MAYGSNVVLAGLEAGNNGNNEKRRGDMTLNALGAVDVACIFISSNLYVAGFQILNMGYRAGAVWAWIAGSIIFALAIFLTVLFIRAYKIQKMVEDSDTSTLRTGKIF